MISSTEILENALKDFSRSVQITRDVRFQANIRLSQRQRLSSYMISFLSLYVISLSLIPNIISLEPFQTQILLACSIILSVFVIFTSLIDGAQNFYHQGELLHQCARKVATVYHKLKNLDTSAELDSSWAKFEELQEEYRRALDDCPINHENIDFIMEQARKPHLFPANYHCKWKLPEIIIKKLYAIIGSHSWMFPHLLMLLVVSVVIYKYVPAWLK